MPDFIPVNRPLLDGNEKKYVLECLETGWISSEGPFVKRFEDTFAQRVGRNHAIAVSSGTAALDIAVEALGIKKGDEVIVPTFTIISCIHQILRVGAIPVFVDCDPLTWNMDVALVESLITEKTRAIMAVHIYGLPVDMARIEALAKKYNLKLIEDAAQAIGQTCYGKPCGSFGDVSTFSFYPNKHVTTGEGGMIFTDDDGIAEACASLRNLCFNDKQRFVHERIGWNYRMTNLQAAIGLAQLETLDRHLIAKNQIGSTYQELLSELVDFIQLPQEETPYSKNSYWVFPLVLANDSCDASEIVEDLRLRNIGCRPFFCPLHIQPLFKDRSSYLLPLDVSVRGYKRGFYIPSGLGISTAEQVHVWQSLRHIFGL